MSQDFLHDEYVAADDELSNSSNVKFLFHKKKLVEEEFGALDYLVMTSVLLISIGMSLSRTLQYRSDVDDVVEEQPHGKGKEKQPPPTTAFQVVFQAVASGGSPTAPFINTLCLFGLAGEVYKNDARVAFFLVGFLLSIVILFVFQYFPILSSHKLISFPAYLKRRFQRKGISIIVAISSIVRQFVGGTLNLCIMCIGVSAIAGVSAFLTSLIITVAAVACTSASRIHSGNDSSIGGILIWLVGITCLATLTVTTSEEGGFGTLISKANKLGKFQLPNLSLIPWEENSLWGFLAIGIVLGFQVFAFSRSTLRHASELKKIPFFCSLTSTFVLISAWTLIGLWAGLCVSVAFEGSVVLVPDGLMARLVSQEMHDMRGFRGFFVSTLFASSVSGLTRRYNQLIELIWESFQDIFMQEGEQEESVNIFVRKESKHLPYEYLKELKWEQRKKTCFSQFFIKLLLGLLIGLTSCGIVFVFLDLNLTVWELWQSIVGIFIGPMVAALLIGLFFPCISHMSLCLGVVVGWAIPCYLMIGNKIHDFGHLSTGDYSHAPVMVGPQSSDMSPDPLHHSSILRALNITQEETVFVLYSDKEFRKEMLQDNQRASQLEKRLDEYSKRKLERKFSVSGKILATSYCYYGPVGMVSCLLSSLLFAGVAGKCNPRLSESAVELLHPLVRKKYKTVIAPSVESPTTPEIPSPNFGQKRKKINALKFIQETAHI